AADLDWTDKKSRSTLEMNDPHSRPAVANRVENMKDYTTVFVGFPIWWGAAPTIINTFLESYDFSDKTVVPFATSGGSGMGNTVKKLQLSVSAKTALLSGKLLNGRQSALSLKSWMKTL
ncbi:MAG: flavodoxin, partial [Oscillospiraceae bacterium]|nr:flavodoxin [Oscillospiraceae bacterium]